MSLEVNRQQMKIIDSFLQDWILSWNAGEAIEDGFKELLLQINMHFIIICNNISLIHLQYIQYIFNILECSRFHKNTFGNPLFVKKNHGLFCTLGSFWSSQKCLLFVWYYVWYDGNGWPSLLFYCTYSCGNRCPPNTPLCKKFQLGPVFRFLECASR